MHHFLAVGIAWYITHFTTFFDAQCVGAAVLLYQGGAFSWLIFHELVDHNVVPRNPANVVRFWFSRLWRAACVLLGMIFAPEKAITMLIGTSVFETLCIAVEWRTVHWKSTTQSN